MKKKIISRRGVEELTRYKELRDARREIIRLQQIIGLLETDKAKLIEVMPYYLRLQSVFVAP